MSPAMSREELNKRELRVRGGATFPGSPRLTLFAQTTCQIRATLYSIVEFGLRVVIACSGYRLLAKHFSHCVRAVNQ